MNCILTNDKEFLKKIERLKKYEQQRNRKQNKSSSKHKGDGIPNDLQQPKTDGKYSIKEQRKKRQRQRQDTR